MSPGLRRRPGLGLPGLAALGLLLAGGAARAHDLAYWDALRASGYAVREAGRLPALADEAIAMLDSPDPHLRDELAYEALAHWIYAERRFDAQALAPYIERLRARAMQGLGQCPGGGAGDDAGKGAGEGLYGRSFALLVLSVAAAADDDRPLLADDAFHGLVDLGIEALGRECDLRGYDPAHGWGHATAHAADLLKFLARNPRLRQQEQARIVAAIEGRLVSAGQVFAWGEDARLAAALAAVASRADARDAPLLAWFARLEQQAGGLHDRFDGPACTRLLAQRNALAHLAALLDPAALGPDRAPLLQGLRHALLASR